MRVMTALPALLLALSAASCRPGGAPAAASAPADSAAGEIPFQYADARGTAILVPVHINGTGPHQFVLDTGATFTCVDRGLQQSLGLPPLQGPVGIGVGVGQTGRFELVRIDSLRVGQARADGMAACVLDLGQFRRLGLPVEGLLGLNFLKQFRLSLDFQRKLLILRK